MEPRQHEVAASTERAPTQGSPFEQFASPELGNQLDFEHHEKVPEVGSIQAEASQVAMPALPVPVLSTSPASSSQGQDDGTPLVANDDDLIEKEWVDKAKRIIAATRDDPYRREREINKLQIEYIRKRYGRTIGEEGN